MKLKRIFFIILFFILILLLSNKCFASFDFTYNNTNISVPDFTNIVKDYYLIARNSSGSYYYFFTSDDPFIFVYTNKDFLCLLTTENYVRNKTSGSTLYSYSWYAPSGVNGNYTLEYNSNTWSSIPASPADISSRLLYSNFDIYTVHTTYGSISSMPASVLNNKTLAHTSNAPLITDYPEIVNNDITIGNQDTDSIWITPGELSASDTINFKIKYNNTILYNINLNSYSPFYRDYGADTFWYVIPTNDLPFDYIDYYNLPLSYEIYITSPVEWSDSKTITFDGEIIYPDITNINEIKKGTDKFVNISMGDFRDTYNLDFYAYKVVNDISEEVYHTVLNSNSEYILRDNNTFYYNIPISAITDNFDEGEGYVFTLHGLSPMEWEITKNVSFKGLTTTEIYENISNDISNMSEDISNSIGQLEDTITDSTVDNVAEDLPSTDVQDPTETGIDNIFQSIYNAFCTGEAQDIVFPFPYTDKNITINPYYVRDMLNNNGANWIYLLIQAFWGYIIGRFIVTDISKKIDKIKSGDIENVENSNIKEDML